MKSFSKNELTRRNFMTTAASSLLGVGLMPGIGGSVFGKDEAAKPGFPMRIVSIC